LFCILKNKHEVSNFPSSIFKEINEVVLKVLSNTKERDLSLICLNVLCQLIENDAVKEGSFFDLANLFFEQIKTGRVGKGELAKIIFSLKSLAKLMRHTKDSKLNSLNLKKMSKKLAAVP
jgi:hypothetical protein